MATSELTARPATRTAAVLDDADSRPGSATSLLRTIVGCYLRRLGGWIAAAPLMQLMTAVGVNQTRTRTAILRVRGKGLLAPEAREGRAGYALEPAAIPALARGDRRIYSARHMATSDRLCLISYSIPESQRQLRHQLRRRLASIGCGTVTAALWICPEHLTGEVEEILMISACAHRPRSSSSTRRGWTVDSEGQSGDGGTCQPSPPGIKRSCPRTDPRSGTI